MNFEKTYISSPAVEQETRKRLKREARQHLAEEMARLLASREDNLYWTGTKTDLMEAVHEVFIADLITDDYGCPETFTRLCDLFCTLFHVVKPRYPRTLVAHATARKGLRLHPFIDRYAYRLQHGDSHPLARFYQRPESQPA